MEVSVAVPEERLHDEEEEQPAESTLFGAADDPYQPGFNMKTIWACLFVRLMQLFLKKA